MNVGILHKFMDFIIIAYINIEVLMYKFISYNFLRSSAGKYGYFYISCSTIFIYWSLDKGVIPAKSEVGLVSAKPNFLASLSTIEKFFLEHL